MMTNFLAFMPSCLPHDRKSQDKNSNISRTERALKMKQKELSIIFKGLSLKEIKPTFFEGESASLTRNQALIYIFLSSDKLSGTNNVASNNVNFRPDIRQDIKSLFGS